MGQNHDPRSSLVSAVWATGLFEFGGDRRALERPTGPTLLKYLTPARRPNRGFVAETANCSGVTASLNYHDASRGRDDA